jgi:NADH:ubiquinone reductase (H+-translocating)
LGAPLGDVYAVGDCATVQNNLAGHIVDFLRAADSADGKDPAATELTFSDWRKVAGTIRRKFPQAANHLKRLDALFYENDRDHSGTLDYNELEVILKLIDGKMTSLPATAQRAHQQGSTTNSFLWTYFLIYRAYLAKKLNKLAKVTDTLHENDIHEGDIDDAVYDPFNYRHLGNLAYLGNSAVFDRGTGGYGNVLMGHLIAMYLWRSVYWSQQVSFRTRALLTFDWFRRAIWGRDFSRF